MPKDATTGAAGTSTTLLPSPVNESWPTAGWRTSAPEAVGMSSRALASLVDFGGANDVDSVLVTRHGQIVAEAYYPPFVPGLKHALNSATKTVVGALVGIAVQRGLLATLDQPVLEALGAHDAANSDAHKRAVTLQHLLDMDSGLAWQEPLAGRPETVFEMTQSPDWTRFVLDRPMAQAPGSGFNYSSGNSHLLSALLSRHTQQSALAFAQQHLFAPLGIDDVTWPSDPQGVSMGGYGLFMQPRDMAKLGYLFLRRGRWQDQQLLSPAWFDRVEHASVPMPSIANSTLRMFYANGFWCAPEYHAYMAMGMLRQVILVMPRLDVVAVFTGRKHYPMSDVFKLLEQAVDDGAAPPNQDATESLRLRIEAATRQQGAPAQVPPAAAAKISGTTYEFPRNPSGMRTLRLTLVGPAPRHDSTVELEHLSTGRSTSFGGPIGLQGCFRQDDAPATDGPDQPSSRVAARGRWLDDETFVLELRLVSEGIAITHTIRLEGTSLKVVFDSNRGPRCELEGRPLP